MRLFFRRWADDNRGVTAILFGIMLPVLCLSMGAAVDYARLAHARSITTNAIDAAVLAGAGSLWRGGADTEALAAAQEHFDANVVDRFAVVNNTVTFALADNGTAVSGSGNAELPTFFLKLAGIETLALLNNPAAQFPKAKITSGGGDIEVALMLDVTGSMCADGEGPCTSGSKLDALKTAAKDLVELVVRDQQTPNTSRVALVPFSKRIRVAPDGAGAGIMKTLTDLDPTWSGWYDECSSYTLVSTGAGTEAGDDYDCDDEEAEQVNNWQIIPCVTDRFYDAPWEVDYTDEAPGMGRWLNANGGRREPISLDSAFTPPTDELGLVESDPADHYNWDENGSCSTDEANQIVPLSADKIALQNKIDGFVAEDTTGGALGTAFSWYMLSPKWNSIWPSSSTPGPYTDLTTMQPNGAPKLRKVAVLMSDGVFNTYRGWDGKDQQEVSDFTVQLCTNMKNAGIEIYTVGFDLDSLTSTERTIAETTLQACGTDIDHFYNTLDPDELRSAFRDIASKLGSVSLVR
ncbi:MAG: hypothetical protein K0U34_04830 [Alphaproteobacteria bacterium]|nr:hypothetical protein [Alphaproteobacteria bacterium]